MAYSTYLSGVCEPQVGHPQKYKDGECKAAKVLRILEEQVGMSQSPSLIQSQQFFNIL